MRTQRSEPEAAGPYLARRTFPKWAVTANKNNHFINLHFLRFESLDFSLVVAG